jgi:DNA invertase Pin-like site-specific DNA recombinase
MKGKALTEEEKKKIYRLIDDGVEFELIADRMQVSVLTIYRLKQRRKHVDSRRP